MTKSKAKPAEKTKYCATNLPLEVYETIRAHAEVFGRSISKEMLFLIRDGIAHREEREFEFFQPKKGK